MTGRVGERRFKPLRGRLRVGVKRPGSVGRVDQDGSAGGTVLSFVDYYRVALGLLRV